MSLVETRRGIISKGGENVPVFPAFVGSENSISLLEVFKILYVQCVGPCRCESSGINPG